MTDIDISPEAVDHLCTCHPDDQPPKPCPQKYALTDCRIAALSAALTQSRAETAAAYDRAALKLTEILDGWEVIRKYHQPGNFAGDAAIASIRSITSRGQSSALASIEAAAEARGMRKAAAIAWAQEDGDRWTRALIQAAILAAIPQGEIK